MNPEEVLNRARRRVRMMSSEDLRLWSDNAVSGMQRQFDDFWKSPDDAHLGEINVALISLGAVVDELAARTRPVTS